MEQELLIDEIKKLKKEKNAIILAHYYQQSEIQDIADYVGDSLGLSIEAKNTNAAIIVFAGVYFMAETAKILNPSKKVLIPDLNASCSLVENCTVEDLRQLKKKYPNHFMVSYINCSAEVKAISDIICTSANAIKVVESIPTDKEILFVPDKNLGAYVQRKTGRNMLFWDASCVVHEAFSLEKIIQLKLKYPKAKIVAHPEAEEHILNYADFIGSTTEMQKYIENSESEVFIVATEEGILHGLKQKVKGKNLIPAPVYEDNTCACGECAYMKVNTLQKLHDCLKSESPEVLISDTLVRKAIVPIEKMLSVK